MGPVQVVVVPALDQLYALNLACVTGLWAQSILWSGSAPIIQSTRPYEFDTLSLEYRDMSSLVAIGFTWIEN